MMCGPKVHLESWFEFMYIYFAFFTKKKRRQKLFNLDSTSTKPDIEDKTDIKDKWRCIKIIVGSTTGCITALVFFILVFLFLRRRYNRLAQEVKDDVVPLKER